MATTTGAAVPGRGRAVHSSYAAAASPVPSPSFRPATAPPSSSPSPILSSSLPPSSVTVSPKPLSLRAPTSLGHDVDFPPPMLSSLAMAMASAAVPISASIANTGSRYDLYVPFAGPSDVPVSASAGYGSPYDSSSYGGYAASSSNDESVAASYSASLAAARGGNPHAASIAAANAVRAASASPPPVSSTSSDNGSTTTSSSYSSTSAYSGAYSEAGYAATSVDSTTSVPIEEERVASQSTCDTLDHQLLLRVRHAYPCVPPVSIPTLSPSSSTEGSNVQQPAHMHHSASDFAHKLGPEYHDALRRDWNEEFQRIYEQKFENYAEVSQRTERLVALSNEFVTFARDMAQYIIRDLATPPDERMIRPILEQKGMAGGLKYRVGNVFFKYANDVHNLYGGDLEAQKAASNELRAINSVIDCNLPSLHITLSSLFFIRGHCLMAIAICPISGQHTLVYGSCDQGRTIVNSNEEMDRLMRQLASKMHVKPHVVMSANGENLYELCSAGDVEGHQSRLDRRFYLIDLARHLPPVPPRPRSADHLYRQFRPEYLIYLQKKGMSSLSSDAWSKWGLHDARIHNTDVMRAHQHLLTDVIPEFASFLEKNASHYTSAKEGGMIAHDMIRELHNRGINVRNLGHVYQCVSPAAMDCRLLLLREMLCRTIKVRYRRAMIELSRDYPSTAPYLDLASRIVRLVTGSNEDSDETECDHYWSTILPQDLSFKFDISTPPAAELRALRRCYSVSVPVGAGVWQQLSRAPSINTTTTTGSPPSSASTTPASTPKTAAQPTSFAALAQQQSPSAKVAAKTATATNNKKGTKSVPDAAAVPAAVVSSPAVRDEDEEYRLERASERRDIAALTRSNQILRIARNLHRPANVALLKAMGLSLPSILSSSSSSTINGNTSGSTTPPTIPSNSSEDDGMSIFTLAFESLRLQLGVKEKRIRNPDFRNLEAADRQFSSLIKLDIREQGAPMPKQLLSVLSSLYSEPDNRAFPIIEQTMKKLGNWGTNFHPNMVSNYLAVWMNQMIVDFVRSDSTPSSEKGYGKQGSAVSKTIVDKKHMETVLTGYHAMHHILIGFAAKYPEIRRRANAAVNAFYSDPAARSKKALHDIGEFLIHLILSDLTWHDIAIHVLTELFTRNALWILKASPELSVLDGPQCVSPCYRARRSFAGSRTGLRLIMFSVFFLTNFTYSGRGAHAPTSRTLERPDQASIARLQTAYARIMKVSEWNDFLDNVNVVRLSPDQLDSRLKQAMRDSATKGYHGERVMKFRRPRYGYPLCLCENNKGTCLYPNTPAPLVPLTIPSAATGDSTSDPSTVLLQRTMSAPAVITSSPSIAASVAPPPSAITSVASSSIVPSASIPSSLATVVRRAKKSNLSAYASEFVPGGSYGAYDPPAVDPQSTPMNNHTNISNNNNDTVVMTQSLPSLFQPSPLPSPQPPPSSSASSTSPQPSTTAATITAVPSSSTSSVAPTVYQSVWATKTNAILANHAAMATPATVVPAVASATKPPAKLAATSTSNSNSSPATPPFVSNRFDIAGDGDSTADDDDNHDTASQSSVASSTSSSATATTTASSNGETNGDDDDNWTTVAKPKRKSTGGSRDGGIGRGNGRTFSGRARGSSGGSSRRGGSRASR